MKAGTILKILGGAVEIGSETALEDGERSLARRFDALGAELLRIESEFADVLDLEVPLEDPEGLAAVALSAEIPPTKDAPKCPRCGGSRLLGLPGGAECSDCGWATELKICSRCGAELEADPSDPTEFYCPDCGRR